MLKMIPDTTLDFKDIFMSVEYNQDIVVYTQNLAVKGNLVGIYFDCIEVEDKKNNGNKNHTYVSFDKIVGFKIKGFEGEENGKEGFK